MSKERIKEIQKKMIQWYEEKGRKLPWRESKNPYNIWISEVMLQQTRIETVKDYYEKFMRQIPNVEILANIEDETLLKLWQGLRIL